MEKNSSFTEERVEYPDFLNASDAQLKQIVENLFAMGHIKPMPEFFQQINLAHDLGDGLFFQRFNKFYEHIIKKINSHNVFAQVLWASGHHLLD